MRGVTEAGRGFRVVDGERRWGRGGRAGGVDNHGYSDEMTEVTTDTLTEAVTKEMRG